MSNDSPDIDAASSDPSVGEPQAPRGDLDSASPNDAARIVETLYPDERVRRVVLDFFATSLERAHASGSDSWNVSVHRDGSVWLNVGHIAVLLFFRDRIEVNVDIDALAEDERSAVSDWLASASAFKTFASSRFVNVPATEVKAHLPRLRVAHNRAIETAAPWYRISGRNHKHRPDIVTYASGVVGRDLPIPSYIAKEASNRLATIAELLRDFYAEYPPSPRGQRHIALYEGARAAARADFKQTLALAAAGENVTERVLRTFLPHTENESNRANGRWIHVAPALSGDVRSKFENAGWVSKAEWSAVAADLLAFVRRCVEHPEAIEEACTEFSRKGFQAGMVSPLLNALRPDKFLVVNVKSLALSNYVRGTRYGAALAQYPAVNAAAFDVVRELSPLLDQDSRPPEISDADLVDMFGHWLYAVRKFFGRPQAEAGLGDIGGVSAAAVPLNPQEADRSTATARYWKVAPGKGAGQWDECREQGFIGVGWEQLGDVSGLTRDEFDALLDEKLPENPDWSRVGASQVWKFAQISIGDRIVANHGIRRVLGIGTVVGPYTFVPGAETAHTVAVHWDDQTPRAYDAGKGWMRTVLELSAELFEAIRTASPADSIVEFVSSDDDAEVTRTELNEAYPLSTVAADSGFDEATLARWVRAIHRKGQAVLYGPPGTGKTFVADRLARHLVGGGYGIREIVQFHPAYAYEDFVVGMRPRARENGGLDYPLVDGTFVDFCDRAREREGVSVLIVDEINRANLSRVFGELMFLLEYREQTVTLAGGRRFSIPENVRILGTMNTADRSIALVDHALRRRFAFLGLAPNYDVLRKRHRGTGFPIDELVGVLARLNAAIGDPHYEIGIAFFLGKDLADTIEDVWRMEIEPYVEEYFFDRRKVFEEFRWEKISHRLGAKREEPE